MKCTIPEISWHNRGPVLSVDLQIGTWKTPAGETFWRLASGGADSHVLVTTSTFRIHLFATALHFQLQLQLQLQLQFT
jgi:hypothetical protein